MLKRGLLLLGMLLLTSCGVDCSRIENRYTAQCVGQVPYGTSPYGTPYGGQQPYSPYGQPQPYPYQPQQPYPGQPQQPYPPYGYPR